MKSRRLFVTVTEKVSGTVFLFSSVQSRNGSWHLFLFRQAPVKKGPSGRLDDTRHSQRVTSEQHHRTCAVCGPGRSGR